MKTIKKKINKEEISLSQHINGVLMEHMDKKFDLLLESQKGLIQTSERLEGKIDAHHEEFKEFRKEVDYKFEAVFDEFHSFKKDVDERFGEVHQRFDEMRSEFTEVHSELHVIRNDLKEKVSRDEFLLLEHRVEKLEHNNKNKK